MNQSEQIDDLLMSGWSIGHKRRSGCVMMYKRDRNPERNYVMPSYFEITVLQDGRVIDGDREA